MIKESESRGIALARGIIVLLIAPIHCVMIYSSPEVKHGLLGMIMAFFAENPGAHLFMFLMGAFIVFSKPKSIGTILKRSIELLAAGYLLNIFKFVIPHWLGVLPTDFYTGNHIVVDGFTITRLLLLNDILHFAGVAYLVCGLVRRTTDPVIMAAVAAVLVLITAPFVWDRATTSSRFLNAGLDLVGGFPPRAYFPLFPWLFHCIAGMLAAYLWTYIPASKRKWVLPVVGALLMLTGRLIEIIEPTAWHITFFRPGPGGTLFHTGVAIIWLWGAMLIVSTVNDNPVFRLFRWYSQHITIIYLVQWVIIMWMFPAVGFEQLLNGPSLLVILFISALSFVITYFIKIVSINSKLQKNESNL